MCLRNTIYQYINDSRTSHTSSYLIVSSHLSKALYLRISSSLRISLSLKLSIFESYRRLRFSHFFISLKLRRHISLKLSLLSTKKVVQIVTFCFTKPWFYDIIVHVNQLRLTLLGTCFRVCKSVKINITRNLLSALKSVKLNKSANTAKGEKRIWQK